MSDYEQFAERLLTQFEYLNRTMVDIENDLTQIIINLNNISENTAALAAGQIPIKEEIEQVGYAIDTVTQQLEPVSQFADEVLQEQKSGSKRGD